jgi:hypothetical protein
MDMDRRREAEKWDAEERRFQCIQPRSFESNGKYLRSLVPVVTVPNISLKSVNSRTCFFNTMAPSYESTDVV